jgi:hypothetical protein
VIKKRIKIPEEELEKLRMKNKSTKNDNNRWWVDQLSSHLVSRESYLV